MEVKDLKKLIENKEYLDNQTFRTIFRRYCKTNASNKSFDLILKYLENYPQQSLLISKRSFTRLLSTTEQQLHPLVIFLASRLDIDYSFDLDNLPIEKWSYLLSAFHQRVPLMKGNRAFISSIKNKIDTYKMLIESPQWFNENGNFFAALHDVEYDKDECEELFAKLKANWSVFKITSASAKFMDFVTEKCDKELEYIPLLITTLFSLSPKSDDVTWLSNHIIGKFKMLKTNCSMEISDWDTLNIKAIKCGLIRKNPVYDFIKVLRKLIKIAKIDKSNLVKSFDLLTGYSQFTSIMLSRNANELQKEEVLKLIETLIKKEPSIMALSHVPLFLCSYNASLSVNDQILLRILFIYENSGIPMSSYRPYLWGSFAVSHYQVKSHLISNTLNSYPSTTEVLSYVPLKRLKETLSNFPVNRILHVKDQKILRFDNYSDPSKMFDPAFFLPMISSLLSTEAPLSIEKFNTSGCLSMALACLGSHDSSMRSAAYHVLKLLRSHLFCKRAENMFWDHFLIYVRKGIQDLHLRPPPQLSMIQALFLSRLVLAIANHEKGIEKTCSKLLLAHPAPQLGHIPELIAFLNQCNGPDESCHVQWFLNIICDGMRSEKDWEVLKNMNLLSKFLAIFTFSTEKDRKLILKIMDSVFRAQGGTNGGIGSWAASLMMAIPNCINKLSVEEVNLVFKCLQSLSNCSYSSIYIVDFWLSIFLDYGNNAANCTEGLITLKSLLSRYNNVYELLNKDDLKDVFCRAKNTNILSADEIFRCQVALEHGISGVQIKNPEKYLFLPVLVDILKMKERKI